MTLLRQRKSYVRLPRSALAHGSPGQARRWHRRCGSRCKATV